MKRERMRQLWNQVWNFWIPFLLLALIGLAIVAGLIWLLAQVSSVPG